MLGEHTVKMESKLEEELKKFLETIISKTGETTIEKVSFENTEGENYNVFGNRASRRVNDIIKIKNKDHSLFYTVNIYYPEDIDAEEWTEQHRKEHFFSISFTENDNRYYIVVNSADSKHFANYEVTVYMKQCSINSNCLSNESPYKIAYYFLAALTEREEYKFIDNLMERAKSLVLRHTHTKNNVSKDKQEFLSIISDVINTGN